MYEKRTYFRKKCLGLCHLLFCRTTNLLLHSNLEFWKSWNCISSLWAFQFGSRTNCLLHLWRKWELWLPFSYVFFVADVVNSVVLYLHKLYAIEPLLCIIFYFLFSIILFYKIQHIIRWHKLNTDNFLKLTFLSWKLYSQHFFNSIKICLLFLWFFSH